VFSRILAPPSFAGALFVLYKIRDKITYVPKEFTFYEISLALLGAYTFFSLIVEVCHYFVVNE
jgi:hypothetical protein